MSSEQNKAIVRRAFEEPWKGNLDVVDELIANDTLGMLQQLDAIPVPAHA